MTITAKVHSRNITLPLNVEIAEGAEVQVIVPERRAAQNEPALETLDWLRKAFGAATSGLTTDEIRCQTRGEN